ncbi:MAG: septum formation protein Maf [Rhodobacteraceae bacterium]|nr:septum formation protein Maf [Paracoccaceae bacterium]MBT4777874.1 septum formation protein Maf [Paracoccaceae bacterium]MBT6272050.1 septum formation protein Maf [Paracoccaceae bacterium]MBT6437547.1 septum formation protein Maf [Paracoccaceae bacterium]MDG2374603.1 Maf family protein [Paracoccaceae bacterium]
MLNQVKNPKKLILGSSSPRRLELLSQLRIKPDLIKSPDIDEATKKLELPRDYCIRMAKEKANAIDVEYDDVLLTADTIVCVGRRILGKPSNEDQVREFLKILSGRRHKVITSVAVKYQDKLLERCVISTVKMKNISNSELDAYVSLEDWKDKAGGYGLQGYAAVFVTWIQGSFSSIIGLPLAETSALLSVAGIRVLK